jgi:Mg2+ and Co2+ transporter CorA
MGALERLSPKKRGRKRRRDPQLERIMELEREVSRLREELRKAELIIEVQKKVARLLGSVEAQGNEEPS